MSAWFTPANILPLFFLVVGFVGRSIWNIVTKRRESLRDLQLRSRIERLESQLSEFTGRSI